ncbi:MAG: fumarylacetoacetate hydrolase family protein [Pseudorhodoplanes sp.]|nr:fumarylacetoacetate hydrolase family protein [Pseudorhodoplanes sp.]
MPQVWYQQPLYYKGNRFSVVGPDADVHWPSYSRYLDFELEWGIFIGRKGRNIPASEARDYIFGYTVFNDFSARDAQYRETEGRLGPAKGKDFDTGNAMGPCIVTADALAEPYNLAMAVRVNGEEWGRGNSRDMHHRFEDMIAHISRDETLYPGEFIRIPAPWATDADWSSTDGSNPATSSNWRWKASAFFATASSPHTIRPDAAQVLSRRRQLLLAEPPSRSCSRARAGLRPRARRRMSRDTRAHAHDFSARITASRVFFRCLKFSRQILFCRCSNASSRRLHESICSRRDFDETIIGVERAIVSAVA